MPEGKANKVKFNIKNVHYALLKESEGGAVTWDKPVKVPGAVSIALDASGEITPFLCRWNGLLSDKFQYWL